MTEPHFSRRLSSATADLSDELNAVVAGEVRFDPYSRLLYSTDASNYQIEPIGAIIPRSLEDVLAAMEVCARRGVAVLPRGSGSSLAGQAVGHAVHLDFSKYLNHVLQVNGEEGWAWVEPGVILDRFNALLRSQGRMFGPDPASGNRCTFGGMIGNNATGSHSILYGMTADQILELKVILADGHPAHLGPLNSAELAQKQEADGLEGELYRRIPGLLSAHERAICTDYPRTWRRASGYSLNYLLPPAERSETFPPGLGGQCLATSGPRSRNDSTLPAGDFNPAPLLAGSEGTLAVITAAKVRLARRPKMTALTLAHFDDLLAAAAATPLILECNPSAVELIDELILSQTRSVPAYARQLTWVRGHPKAILAIEVYGEGEAELLAQIERVEDRLRREKVTETFVRAMTPAEQAQVWGVRKAGLGLLMSVRGDAKPLSFMEDISVPVESLADYLRDVLAIFAEHRLKAGIYAHASAGCLHIRPMISLKSADGVHTMRTLSERMVELVIRYRGAMSGEHGDGLARSCWNERLFGRELYGAFRELKQAWDPHGILNPGKIVDAPDMTENLRYGPDYQTIPITTHLSFATEGGFARAVEQCNGAAVCRKEGVGTMCPSFMATHEEEHSTRGRANALRAALSGVLPPAALTERRMYDVLDLCLECKGCRAECPSSVDLAKIKYEFLTQYYAKNGLPRRAWLFGHIHSLSRIGLATAPLSNLAGNLPLVRSLMQWLLGIDARRALPPFAIRPFDAWFRTHNLAKGRSPLADGRAEHRPEVVLFHDTFMTYNYPEVGKAAVQVLESAGFAVRLVEQRVCCGRPMISKGQLESARANARRNVELLAPYAERSVPIIGCEPSCILTLRDEYLDLLDDRRARMVADHTFLFEEFLAKRSDEGKLELSFCDIPAQVLAHGHCHQKALTGSEAMMKVLRLAGCQATEVDSGCCGMAGAFGFEAEHYDISMQIGGLRLFPAIEAAGPEVTIVAPGISCRQQIGQATGRAVKHPAEVLAERLR